MYTPYVNLYWFILILYMDVRRNTDSTRRITVITANVALFAATLLLYSKSIVGFVSKLTDSSSRLPRILI